jgi:hypothetical protein
MSLVFRDHTSLRKLVVRILSFLLACNYFAFRTELFSEEYEENHPNIDPWNHQVIWSASATNWETFDKDNAPKAIKVEPRFSLVFLCRLPGDSLPAPLIAQPTHPVRDKSPPNNWSL